MYDKLIHKLKIAYKRGDYEEIPKLKKLIRIELEQVKNERTIKDCLEEMA